MGKPRFTPASFAKRDLVQMLLSIRDMKFNDPQVAPAVMAAQYKAIRLTDSGIDWRNHVVQSKEYRGTLGQLFDEFRVYWHEGLRWV